MTNILESLKKLVDKYPNDAILGAKLREFVNKNTECCGNWDNEGKCKCK